MQVFESVADFEKFVLDCCKVAVTNAEEKIHKTIDTFLKQYYSEFTPREYIRTNQLLHSLVKTGVKSTGNGYEAEVYFDVGRLNYETGLMYLQHTAEHGRFGWATWSGGQVLETAMQGSHGGYTGAFNGHGSFAGAYGTPIWAASMAKLGNIIQLLVKELRAAGIPIH